MTKPKELTVNAAMAMSADYRDADDVANPRCKDCHAPTDAGPCPGCGALVCQNCAEREGEFCCDEASQ